MTAAECRALLERLRRWQGQTEVLPAGPRMSFDEVVARVQAVSPAAASFLGKLKQVFFLRVSVGSRLDKLTRMLENLEKYHWPWHDH